MKTVTLRTAKSKFGSLLRLVADGEEIEIIKKGKAIARLVPPAAERIDWSETFAKLDDVWGNNHSQESPEAKLSVKVADEENDPNELMEQAQAVKRSWSHS
jgi:prevent-host-death family protein